MFKSVPFYKFTDFVVPLIMEQPEPGFDDLLSLWMGNDVQRQYSKWKNNEGRNRTAEEQINKLMAIWQAYMGLKANIVTFIELIEAKNGTKWIVDQLRKEFGHCYQRYEIASSSSSAPRLAQIVENPLESNYINQKLLLPEHKINKSNSWHCYQRPSHITPRTSSISSNFFTQIGNVFRGKNRDYCEDDRFNNNGSVQRAKMNNYVSESKMSYALKTPMKPEEKLSSRKGVYTDVHERVRLYTILLMGSESVGKNTLLRKVGATLDTSKESGGYYDQYTSSIIIGDETIVVQYLILRHDTKHLDDKAVRQIYMQLIKMTDGVILLYDITNKLSFTKVKFKLE